MKKLKVTDYLQIKPYLDMANYEGCNSNFITMMMWNHEYHIEYEIHDHFLVMLHNYKGLRFWAMPFTTQEYYHEAIDYMMNYSQKHQFDFIIDCAIEEFVDKIKEDYKEQLLFERTEYNDDYIYDRHMQQSLTGKKMQKRRNHFNAFMKQYPNYLYRELDAVKDFDIILKCLNRWENKKENLSESLSSEVRGIMALLSYARYIDFKMGGIFINGEMEAFIIASQLNRSTLQIHVEKANKEIRGLYPAILKEFLEHHYPDELYLNREEDMGLENLRKAKTALQPILKIHKYRIIKKQTHIQKANDDDYNEIVSLWKDSFQDEDEESTQYYFQNLYQKEHTYVYKNNHQILSVLQIVPMEFMIQSKKEHVYFILGVCTKKAFEGQGCMRTLMNYVLSLYKDKRIYLQAYVPQIYNRFGFTNSHYHQLIEVNKEYLTHDKNLVPTFDKELLKAYYKAYTKQFDEYRIRDEKYWDLLIERCRVFKQEIVVFQDLGYMLYSLNDESILIHEFIYLSHEAAVKMLSYFDRTKIILECDLSLNIEGQKQIIMTMMSNQDNTKTSDRYINEIY